MNVGPTARGYFDYRAESALSEYAKWMKYNSRSIYGCTMAEPDLKAPDGCVLTQSEDGKRLYVHIFDYPFVHLSMENIADKIEYVQFLHDASEIKLDTKKLTAGSWDGGGAKPSDGNDAMFYLPVIKPNIIVPTIEIFLK